METRLATDRDVAALRDLFIEAYGNDYPYPQFYETEWLKRTVYDDSAIVVVAEHEGRLCATGTVVLNAGGYNDMVGELGRLVSSPSAGAAGAAAAVVRDLLSRIERKVLFAFGETRTVHRGSQRLSEQFGWQPIGFEPLKYRLLARESMMIYAHAAPMARELRRNNPRVIPEVALLAQTALGSMGFPVDAIVEDETDGYPTGASFVIESLEDSGVTPLLRIERGRVRNREVFGNFTLAHGFFQIADRSTHYLVARDGAAVVGALGYSWDHIDRKIRIFEMIEFSDEAKGFLLREVNRVAGELGAEYQEVDISAHSPRMQRTLERLGYVPVAYLPSMVFEQVERLDIVRMARLNVPYDPENMRLSSRAARVADIVERRLEERVACAGVCENVRRARLFHGMPEGDMLPLLRIARPRSFAPGTIIIRQGDPTDRIFILGEGRASVQIHGQEVASLAPGEVFGEMGLLERAPRSADVVLPDGGSAVEMEIDSLERLLEQRPRLGHTVMRNLAAGLSEKLRRK